MPTRRAGKPSPKAVVAASEASRLLAYLRLRQPIDTAIRSGRVLRTKVAEAWLLHPSSLDRAGLVAAAADNATQILSEWLLVRMPVMAGMMSAQLDPPCSQRAARALLHELVHEDHITALGMLTAAGEPYLGLYRHDDREEIERQLEFVRTALALGSSVGYGDLPSTQRPVPHRAWTEPVLLHAEFHCWGRLRAGVIEPWRGL